MNSKAYRASATGGYGVTADTPRAAALKFFEKFPNKRKCSVMEGTVDGVFFTMTFGPAPNWPQSWKDVTAKTAAALPSG
jgi:hypothetical protein